MSATESLATFVKNRSQPEHINPYQSDADENNFYFAMNCGGYYMHRSRVWDHFTTATGPFADEFRGQRISFFGPGHDGDRFFTEVGNVSIKYETAMRQKSVVDVISKFRRTDEDQAARIAYLLGGIVRYQARKDPGDIARSVNFAAQMVMLSDRKSADAVASSMAMYIISGGDVAWDEKFADRVTKMAQAVSEDPISPRRTVDLGVSQTSRLRAFTDKIYGGVSRPFPDISSSLQPYQGFPTVGAEFHFRKDAPAKIPNLWQQLALLNISQYQRGSYIQLSRMDRNLVEIRMNPSIYPVTIVNWKRMLSIVPELKQAYFTLTLNRTNNAGDFSWASENDSSTLNKLRALGLLCYAGLAENVPPMTNRHELDFGGIYLGQTVRKSDGDYVFTGNWGGREGTYGQLGIYTGYGDALPYLAYYCSMALHNLGILRDTEPKGWLQTRTLTEAVALEPDVIRDLFNQIRGNIREYYDLEYATAVGNFLVGALEN